MKNLISNANKYSDRTTGKMLAFWQNEDRYTDNDELPPIEYLANVCLVLEVASMKLFLFHRPATRKIENQASAINTSSKLNQA
jgi:hypothetical protein